MSLSIVSIRIMLLLDLSFSAGVGILPDWWGHVEFIMLPRGRGRSRWTECFGDSLHRWNNILKNVEKTCSSVFYDFLTIKIISSLKVQYTLVHAPTTCCVLSS